MLQRQAEWVSDARATVPYQETAVRRYGKLVERFREGLLATMHMLGGMPARAWEILEIRHTNTAHGGARNVMVDRGMVMFVTLYHKNYRSAEQVKVIHRYLPREVGELVVWYLWLVLPFWQQVQGMMTGGDRPSAFLWADEVVGQAGEPVEPGAVEPGAVEPVEPVEPDRPDNPDDVDAAGPGGAPGRQQPTRERPWTPDRMRRIMQQQSARYLGTQVGISAWRQIAVAISNRYLNKAFGQDAGHGGDEEDEDEADNMADLQAGHSTHVAGMIYARELQQGTLGTAAKRDGFRAVSRQWHRFLGFGADDRGPATGKRAREPFDSAREEARFRRFARLRQVDIRGRLQQMVGVDARFRGSQERVIRAIIRGETPIIQVAGTGGGKSMSFMLPAYCSPEGVTIVVVPLVALRQDLHGRCGRSGIEAHVWQGRGANRGASIVFVTPESAVTKGFRAFINQLQARGQLDRVVVDECHAVLDSDRAFRPQMAELGEAVQGLGVQAVFLTATLAPADEAEFYARMRLPRPQVVLFRERTTRGNVAYQVRAVRAAEVDEEVCRVVRQGLEQHSGRVIVYSGEIARVERLGGLLSSGVFHSKVDTAEGKERRLQAWAEGTGAARVIVTTNALGMGIDIPDVRLVVHAGAPRRLRDYAQESGRAGRDGARSEAVIVQAGQGRSAGGDRGREESWFDDGMEEFLGPRCRRVVLDRVMDGWAERTGCEEGEEACDLCAGKREAKAEAAEAQVAEEADTELNLFLRAQEEPRAAERRQAAETRKQGDEVDAFRRQLESWACCLVCRVERDEEQGHEMGACPMQGTEAWEACRDGLEVIEEEMFRKKRFERYSGCFYCGLPQGLCDRWAATDDDGGRFARAEGGSCQYEGVLVRMYVGLMFIRGEAGLAAVREMAERDGVDSDVVSWYKWLGRRVRWGGVEASELCRVCVYLERIG